MPLIKVSGQLPSVLKGKSGVLSLTAKFSGPANFVGLGHLYPPWWLPRNVTLPPSFALRLLLKDALHNPVSAQSLKHQPNNGEGFLCPPYQT